MNMPVPIPKIFRADADSVSFNMSIYIDEECLIPSINYFTYNIKLLYSAKSEFTDKENAFLSIRQDSSLESEGYELCLLDKLYLKYADKSGCTHALSVLMQLIETSNGMLNLPKSLYIKDYPDKEWRGLMIDLARQWHPFEHLKKYVDFCWFYRMNRLHLHFTDDQGYRLPSEIFPGLTSELCYSKEQLNELNEYAEMHGVTIVPEIDMPGHSLPIIKAYPKLFGNDGENPEDNLMCAGKDGIFDNLDKLIDEICLLFPYSPYIHIGGDEADIKKWTACDTCIHYCEKNNIHGEKELYSHFISKATALVLEKNRIPIVWEGFPDEGSENIPHETIVMEFESYYNLAPNLLKKGFRIINAAWQPLYIVPGRHWDPEEIYNWNVYEWRSWVPFSAAYNSPIKVTPSESMLGAQLCSWENSYDGELPVLAENIPASAERMWNISPLTPFENYCGSIGAVSQKISKIITEVIL